MIILFVFPLKVNYVYLVWVKPLRPCANSLPLALIYGSELGSPGTICFKSPLSIWTLRGRIVKWDLWKTTSAVSQFCLSGRFSSLGTNS